MQTADLFNDGCTIPELDIASVRCKYMDEAILEMSKIFADRAVFIVSSNFIGPDNYINDTISLAERVTRNGSNLIVVMPNPTYPGLADGGIVDKDICKIQWFRPSFSLGELCDNGFRINRNDIVANRERVNYKSRLESHSKENKRFFVYDPFDDLCIRDTPLDKSCSPYRGDKLLYYDDNHINIYGAKALYPGFRSFLFSNALIDKSR